MTVRKVFYINKIITRYNVKVESYLNNVYLQKLVNGFPEDDNNKDQIDDPHLSNAVAIKAKTRKISLIFLVAKAEFDFRLIKVDIIYFRRIAKRQEIIQFFVPQQNSFSFGFVVARMLLCSFTHQLIN